MCLEFSSARIVVGQVGKCNLCADEISPCGNHVWGGFRPCAGVLGKSVGEHQSWGVVVEIVQDRVDEPGEFRHQVSH